MGLFDFREKWDSGVGQTSSDENKFGGQTIDETKDNPLLQELKEFKSGDSSKSVPDTWQDSTSAGGSEVSLDGPSGKIRGACMSSSTCPSGWSCVDGFCQKTSISTNTGSASTSAGDCDIKDSELRTITRTFQCGSSSRTACFNGGTCGDGAEQVQRDWPNSGWKTINSIYGGGCCNNPSRGLYYAILPDGTRRRVKYCGPSGEDASVCTSFCNSVGSYAPELTNMFDCGDKGCPDPDCQECHFGQCRTPLIGGLPCQCTNSPCPSCMVCDPTGGCTVNKDACKQKPEEPTETADTSIGDCRIQCNCHADCPSGTCGEDLRCAGDASSGGGDTSFIYIEAG